MATIRVRRGYYQLNFCLHCAIFILARGFPAVFPSWAGFFVHHITSYQQKGHGTFPFTRVLFCFSPIFQKYRFLTSNVGTNMTLISFSNSDRLSGASSCFTLPSLVYPVTSRIKLPYCELGAYLLLSLK